MSIMRIVSGACVLRTADIVFGKSLVKHFVIDLGLRVAGEYTLGLATKSETPAHSYHCTYYIFEMRETSGVCRVRRS